MGKKSAPEAPKYQIPAWAQALPPEILGYIREGVGKELAEPEEYEKVSAILEQLGEYRPPTLAEPEEYGISSQALQQMLTAQPEQFQLPIQDIQQALASQQAIQMEQYQKQIRPVLAQQGQIDSTYYANLLSDYKQGQQAQMYGTTADLLTQQAQENLATQRWLPEYRSGVAGQLGGLGGQRAALGQYNIETDKWLPQFQSAIASQLQGLGGQRAAVDQYNLQLPYQTYIPALQSQYTSGLTQAGQMNQAAQYAHQSQMEVWKMQEQQRQQMMQQLGQMGMGAVTGGLGGLSMFGGAGGLAGVGQGALGGAFGLTPTINQAQAPSTPGTYRYNPKWGGSTTPSGYGGSIYIPGSN